VVEGQLYSSAGDLIFTMTDKEYWDFLTWVGGENKTLTEVKGKLGEMGLIEA
jgi:hypothetical protein